MSRRALARRPGPPAVRAGRPLAACSPARAWVAAALLAAALCGVLTATRLADLGGAAVRAGAGALSTGLDGIDWTLVPVIAALTALHYLASALGVRAVAGGVSGRHVGAFEAMTAQFAGAAANRLAPAGLGAAAVGCRYLTRRGLPAAEAAAAVAAAGVMRGLTKLALVLPAVVVWDHLGGPPPALHLAARRSSPLVPVLIAVGATLAIALVAILAGRGRVCGAARAAVAGVARPLGRLLRRPGRLASSLAASAGANLALALAFAVSVLAIPGAGDPAPAGLVAVYLLGATAGAAIPAPAGVGPTEAMLITALAAVHLPAAQAAQGVLLFRIMTFWAPVPVGVLSTRWLRGRGGL